MIERVAFGFGLWGAARIGNRRILSFVKGLANHYLRKKEDAVNSPVYLAGRRDGRYKKSIMAYTPQQIANYFLERAEIEGRPITQLKLIKLVYIAYGWYLALKDERLFFEEIEAWKHGPVIPSLYHEFKIYGSKPINKRSYDVDLDTWEFHAPQIDPDDEETKLILDRVWGAYKNFSGWALREKTHEPDSPWSKVYDEDVRSITLNDGDIREHFTHKIRSYLDAARVVRERRTS